VSRGGSPDRVANESQPCFATSDARGRRRLNVGEAFPKENEMILNDLRVRFGTWLYYRQTVEALRHANDAMLADAGIKREEIRRLARAAVYRGN
jgi:uncharacterized protein YjiS (DUF1127 family)